MGLFLGELAEGVVGDGFGAVVGDGGGLDAGGGHGVGEAFGKHIQAQHGDEDHQAGEEGGPSDAAEEELFAVGEDVAPGGVWWFHAGVDEGEGGFSMIFVSHDLALVAKLAHKITVMYAGQVVEQATTSELLVNPRHEYTRGLLGAVLSIESGADRLYQVPGTVPSPREFVAGDRFAPRSSHPTVGLDEKPTLRPVVGVENHRVACTDALAAVTHGLDGAVEGVK